MCIQAARVNYYYRQEHIEMLWLQYQEYHCQQIYGDKHPEHHSRADFVEITIAHIVNDTYHGEQCYNTESYEPVDFRYFSTKQWLELCQLHEMLQQGVHIASIEIIACHKPIWNYNAQY